MFITCLKPPPPIPYHDRKGVLQLVTLRPGGHNYPDLYPKNDAILAETLRVLRKHHKISFDDLLPGDNEILKSCPKGKKPVDHLAEKVLIQPTPVGRSVSNKSDAQKKKEKEISEKANKVKRARKDKAAQKETSTAAGNQSDGGKSGKVSDKK